MTSIATRIARATGIALLSSTVWLGAAQAQTPSAPVEAGCTPAGAQSDPAACRREGGAAKQEAARGGLTSPSTPEQGRNGTDRCGSLPAGERADCMKRMGASGSAGTTTSSGSVGSGGIIRETVTPVPAK